MNGLAQGHAGGAATVTSYQQNLLDQRVRKAHVGQNTIALYGEAEQDIERMKLGLPGHGRRLQVVR